jgi:hypothetical protein
LEACWSLFDVHLVQICVWVQLSRAPVNCETKRVLDRCVDLLRREIRNLQIEVFCTPLSKPSVSLQSFDWFVDKSTVAVTSAIE